MGWGLWGCCNKDATHTFPSALTPCLTTRPPQGCVRNITEIVFHCYFGHEIERVPVKFGDVRVPFVVKTCMFPWETGFFSSSCVSRGKLFLLFFFFLFWGCKTLKRVWTCRPVWWTQFDPGASEWFSLRRFWKIKRPVQLNYHKNMIIL